MRTTLHNLQALRGIACLVVLLYHIGGYEATFWTKWRTFHVVRWFGYAGVDLFFVLSGFIITWAHRDQIGQAKKLPRYLLRRFLRIYPVLWASAIATIILLGALGTAVIFPEGWRRDYLEWMLLWPRPDPFRFIAATWSLHYEILFYLMFGVLFLVPKRCALPLALAWVTAIAGCWLANTFPNLYWARMMLTPYVLEFLGGAGVATIVARGVTKGSRLALILAFVWTLSFIVLLRGPNPDDLGGWLWGRCITFGPSSILLVYAFVAGELTQRLHLPRMLQSLGDASYSIYLMHGPVTLTLVHLMWGMNTNLPTHLIWLFVQIVAGLGSGWLMYRLVERPLLKSRRKPVESPPAASRTLPISLPFSLNR